MAKLKTTNTISLKDLRQNFPEFIEKIEKGKSFVVIKRSQPVFKISPVEEDLWEPVIDFSLFKPNGLSASQLLKTIDKLS